MKRLMIVSNRLPVTIEKKQDTYTYKQSVGGLATAIGSFYQEFDSVWVGWPGITSDRLTREDRISVRDRLMEEYKNLPVFLSKKDLEQYYHGFSNNTIWPLFHYFSEYTEYDREQWRYYRKVNQEFFDEVMTVARPDDTIWIQDYHLMLLPGMLRKKLPEASIGFFLHIPFPSYEIFRLLPWREEILEGLMGSDLIGFHTYEYARHFLSSVHRLLGYDHSMSTIHTGGRMVKVDIFPIGIDFNKFNTAASQPEVKREMTKFKKDIQERKVVLSVDRLDYSKGLPLRLEAIDTFLKEYPEYRKKVVFIQLIVPSREQVDSYQMLKTRVDNLIGHINGHYGRVGWVPIWYFYRSLPFSKLMALYNLADVALVTPVRDGMNLVAKEYVAAKKSGKGMLVLSEMAGAAQELGEAIIVNPNDSEDIIRGLKDALEMPEEEKTAKMRSMQKRIKQYDVVRWAQDFFASLDRIKGHQAEMAMKLLTDSIREKLVSRYADAKRRLLLLDYDGTLAPIVDRPERAKPSAAIIEILSALTSDEKNSLVIISGRDRETLDAWLSDLPIAFVAEHGAWIKEQPNGVWEMIEPLSDDWKADIRPIFDLFTDRTPRSFVEEKKFSLVWHYRNVTSELANDRVRELVDELTGLTAGMNLQVLEGKKVVEVKNSGINKGRAAQRWLGIDGYDFIMAAGDDWTDEDLFAALPEDACSIRIGLVATQAAYNLKRQRDIQELLGELAGVSE